VLTTFRNFDEARKFLKQHYDNTVGDSKIEGALVVAVTATGPTLQKVTRRKATTLSAVYLSTLTLSIPWRGNMELRYLSVRLTVHSRMSSGTRLVYCTLSKALTDWLRTATRIS
jgi:hypothetical protein